MIRCRAYCWLSNINFDSRQKKKANSQLTATPKNVHLIVSRSSRSSFLPSFGRRASDPLSCGAGHPPGRNHFGCAWGGFGGLGTPRELPGSCQEFPESCRETPGCLARSSGSPGTPGKPPWETRLGEPGAVRNCQRAAGKTFRELPGAAWELPGTSRAL